MSSPVPGRDDRRAGFTEGLALPQGEQKDSSAFVVILLVSNYSYDTEETAR